MRTIILASSLFISDGLYAIAESNGYVREISESVSDGVAMALIVCAIMDGIDFIRNRR